jgi:outer membrane lipoprotein SlyB
MSQNARFLDLSLDEAGLHTPDRTMPVADLVKAAFIRDLDKEDAQSYGGGPSAGAVVGGAVAGGIVAGVPGAIGGALIGGAVSDEEPHRTYRGSTVQIVFATKSTTYRRPIEREDEHAAYEFVEHVKRAMKG